MQARYAKGSEWRKWDLHIHTPFSVLNNEFSDDWDEYVHILFSTAISNGIACIGITDYFSIDGYKKLKTEYLKKPEKLRALFSRELLLDSEYINKITNILVLPNIELRLENVLVKQKQSDGSYKDFKLEYHLILSDELTVEDIEQNILSQLHFTSECSAQLGTDMLPLTRSNLEKLGSSLKNCQAEFSNNPDYYIGCMNAAVSFSELETVFKKNQNFFLNKYLFILVEDDITQYNWKDSGHQLRKRIYANSHMIFSSNAKTKTWGLSEETKSEFSSYKGCIWGSDAHNIERLFLPDNDNFCWIKADVSFHGLVQAAIHPHDRCFIGNTPRALAYFSRHKSLFIDSIQIKKNDDAKNQEHWFDADIPINSGLVAIIGNKGSGKSALSDIMGYLCHSSTILSASFLSKDRFQQEDKKFAADYMGRIHWADGHSITENSLLRYAGGSSQLEYAKYLPQKFIEGVCSNIGDEFQNEINRVIFSYIEPTEKGEATNLEALIERKSYPLQQQIHVERQKLELINSEIIKLEDLSAPLFLSECKQKLSHLQEQLLRLDANKPEKAPEPKEQPDTNAQRLQEIDAEIENIESKIIDVTAELRKTSTNMDLIKDIKSDIKSISSSVELLNKKYTDFLSRLSIYESNDLLALRINTDKLDEVEANIQKERNKLLPSLSEVNLDESSTYEDIESLSDKSNSLYYQKFKLEYEKRILLQGVSDEQKIYQKYKDDLVEWEKQKKNIIGDINTDNTVKYFEEKIRFINEDLNDKLSQKDKERIDCLKSIHSCLTQTALILKDIYVPVKEKLSRILKVADDAIDFSADIIPRGSLTSELSEKIDKNAKSPLRGTSTANAKFDELIRGTDFNSSDSSILFFQSVIGLIREERDNISRVVRDRKHFNEFLSNLNYLTVEYTLKLGRKKIRQLSPGERGLVLLVFYLALSKENIPLIIDQPEDNLDNQSIYSKLVPCILEAKKNRQVIIVTHNPNIAVACDAEQMIY